MCTMSASIPAVAASTEASPMSAASPTTVQPMIKKSAFRKASKAFMELQPSITEAAAVLKDLKKQSGAHVKLIKQYMQEQSVSEMDIGGFTFVSEEKERCRWSEDNLLSILEDPTILDKYKDEFTTTKTSFSIKRPKRPRTEAEE